MGAGWLGRKGLVYWSVVLAAYLGASLRAGNFELYWILPVLAGVFFLLGLILSRLFRPGWAVMIAFAATLGLAGHLMAAGSGLNSAFIASLDYTVFDPQCSVSCDTGTGVYTIRAKNEALKILQLTDIHLGGSVTTVHADRRAIRACYDLIRQTQPDLIIVTGDIVYPLPGKVFCRNNGGALCQFCDLMNRVGIPWAMVYGNHDTEACAAWDAEALDDACRELSAQAGCPMLYAQTQPGISGRYNQYLRIENRDGSLNRLIFLLDSNEYVPSATVAPRYDSVHADQIRWYADTIDRISAQEGRTVPSFVFMHIPFRAFADAQAELSHGGSDAVWLFGTNGEAVSPSESDSGFFQVILRKGSTQAVFVGHDHLNNMGIRYKGVDLVYSKSIDYTAYARIGKKTAQRGATLITLSPEDYRIRQVDYDK